MKTGFSNFDKRLLSQAVYPEGKYETSYSESNNIIISSVSNEGDVKSIEFPDEYLYFLIGHFSEHLRKKNCPIK